MRKCVCGGTIQPKSFRCDSCYRALRDLVELDPPPDREDLEHLAEEAIDLLMNPLSHMRDRNALANRIQKCLRSDAGPLDNSVGKGDV